MNKFSQKPKREKSAKKLFMGRDRLLNPSEGRRGAFRADTDNTGKTPGVYIGKHFIYN